MTKHAKWTARVGALVLGAGLACDAGPGVDDRDIVVVVVTETGGESSGEGGSEGDEGDDEAQVEWEEGAPQVCEEAVGLAAFDEPDLGEWTSRPDVAAGQVACPTSGVAVAKYVDYTCAAGKLTCKHFCGCETTFSSPCNPPHADCGPPSRREGAISNSWDFFSQTECQLLAWAWCRKQTGLSAVQDCATWCKNNTPGRALDCPNCPK